MHADIFYTHVCTRMNHNENIMYVIFYTIDLSSSTSFVVSTYYIISRLSFEATLYPFVQIPFEIFFLLYQRIFVCLKIENLKPRWQFKIHP